MMPAISPSATSADSVKRLLPWLVAVAFFMEALDTTIINTAVPTIAGALEVGPLSLKAALTSYALSLAVFIPVSGWVADRFGTRRVFAAAVVIFTLGSLLSGLSVSLPMLVGSRIVQGFGGAMMMPVGRIAMVRTFPKSELLKAMSFVVIPGLIGPTVGPLVGGLIVHFLHWRVIFFVNIPIGLLGLYLILQHMPDYRLAQPAPLDGTGFVLFGLGIALLSYVLEVFGEHGMGTGGVLFLLAVAIALLALYWRHAMSLARPLLRLELFATRTFRVAVVGSFLTRLGVGGMPFLLPLLYQIGLGFQAWQAGLLLMPQALAAMSMKVIVQHILTRFGHRRVLIVNTCLIGLTIALFATVTSATPVWLIVLQAFLFGFFSSLQYSSMNTLVFADLGDADTSMGSSISSTVQQLSVSFGIALASLITGLFLGGATDAAVPQMTRAIHYAFIVLGAVTMMSTLLFGRLHPNDGQSVSRYGQGT
jgi:EmrB/QacA subfamily drug resistance transporter